MADNMNVLMHNMTAMFTNRQLGITNTNRAKSTEKLSSGYKINRAADDAAGLTISEKLRSQVRGLNQGAKNIQDGISFCQVADGAMAEVNDMLQRITELSIKAANGTNTDEDRKAIDSEVQELLQEIDRIGDSTEFNERKVFPSNSTGIYKIDNPTANSKFFSLFEDDDISKTGYMSERLDHDLIVNLNKAGKGTNYNDWEGNDYVGVHIDFGALFSGDKVKELSGTSFFVNCCTYCCPDKISFADTNGVTRNGDEVTIGLKKQDGTYYSSAQDFLKSIVGGYGQVLQDAHVEYAYNNSTLYIYDIDNAMWSEDSKKSAYFCDVPDDFQKKLTNKESADTLYIHMGPVQSDGMEIKLHELSANMLGLSGKNCLSIENSKNMIESSKKANDIINEKRSLFGAYQNRLEHSYAINTNTAENTDVAESRIRDTDMAEEMVRFTKEGILQQAGQSMLAQANQNRQGLLSLLQ